MQDDVGAASGRRDSMNVNLSATGVVLSLGALGALVYEAWTYTGHGPIQISIPAMIAMSALCLGVALLIATSWTRPRV